LFEEEKGNSRKEIDERISKFQKKVGKDIDELLL